MLPDTIQKEFSAIHEISEFIHQNPELGYKEFKASAALKKFLSDRGFTIRENLGGVETAFLAECDSPGAGLEIPLFGFIAEYDALAGLGHACGHNLIASVALAALLETRARLDKAGTPYRLCCIGTPAEETLGGKVRMIEGGAFEGVAAAIEGHPFNKTMPDPGCLSVARCTISFYGKASHAAIAPEKGINALDAVCEFICAIRKWRLQIGERERVHGIITKGGDAPNIIPEYTEAFYYVRAPSEQAIGPLKKHLEELAQAAAAETGCRAEVKWVSAYKGMVFNTPLNEEFVRAWKNRYGTELPMTDGSEGKGSSDTGDVSYVMPCAQYYFGVTGGENQALHTVEFREAAASDQAFQATMETAAAMSDVAVRYCSDPQFRQSVHEAWKSELAKS